MASNNKTECTMPGTCVWGAGRVALVTGGARRVGRLITLALHRHHYNVIIHCCSSKLLALELAAELNSCRQDSAHVITGDLSQNVGETTRRMVTEAEQKWGRLDLLVNSAADYFITPLPAATEHDWDKLMNINAKAPYFLTQAAAPHLQKVRGNIVNVADILAERPTSTLNIYCTTKATLIMITKSLAIELGPEVRVNYVSPGAAQWPPTVNDNFKKEWLSRTPLDQAGTGEEVADAVVFLASPSASYITGSGINVCGGRSIVH
ncbi:3-oxoacyl-[acyl-carrier-protein] reductase FabG-like isoform X2 [Homarus americanus]|uniref:3-oxoacyl-[acyl-carrier-protein] reductase FabG-like isoform X2 n=1 Tax=Homarus americanus TaxID=6706 RepID=UPI001C48EC6C|nr:3-oxoacyl-[acyl-carrier-protein] reductase FabG-like isoform X2 [Homarus americanus]